jgi:hypothetical protein
MNRHAVMNRQTTAQAKAKNAPPIKSGILQRECACGQHATGGECAECEKRKRGLQRLKGSGSEAAGVPPIVHEVLHSSGQPLDANIRASMEPRFGQDFSGVRVHSDARAAESTHAVNALAYTVGRDIVFGTGQYKPGTLQGQSLLAHELAHVVQQDFRTPAGALALGPEDDAYEREAKRIGSTQGPGSSERAAGSPWTPLTSARVQRLGANPTCTKAEADGIHQAIFDARGWLNKAIPKLEESPLKPAVVAALQRNFGPTYGVAANAALIVGRLKTARGALGRISFSCDTAAASEDCKNQRCGWAFAGSNAATICTNPPSTLSSPFPFAAKCVLHESLHASMAFMTVDRYKGDADYPGQKTEPLLNADSYTSLAADLS